jgi:hypothetical protein
VDTTSSNALDFVICRTPNSETSLEPKGFWVMIKIRNSSASKVPVTAMTLLASGPSEAPQLEVKRVAKKSWDLLPIASGRTTPIHLLENGCKGMDAPLHDMERSLRLRLHEGSLRDDCHEKRS